MKLCPLCGDKYLGFGDVCDKCRRNPPQEKAIGTIDAIVKEGQDRKVCPSCGRKIPLTPYERVKRWRAKNK